MPLLPYCFCCPGGPFSLPGACCRSAASTWPSCWRSSPTASWCISGRSGGRADRLLCRASLPEHFFGFRALEQVVFIGQQAVVLVVDLVFHFRDPDVRVGDIAAGIGDLHRADILSLDPADFDVFRFPVHQGLQVAVGIVIVKGCVKVVKLQRGVVFRVVESQVIFHRHLPGGDDFHGFQNQIVVVIVCAADAGFAICDRGLVPLDGDLDLRFFVVLCLDGHGLCARLLPGDDAFAADLDHAGVGRTPFHGLDVKGFVVGLGFQQSADILGHAGENGNALALEGNGIRLLGVHHRQRQDVGHAGVRLDPDLGLAVLLRLDGAAGAHRRHVGFVGLAGDDLSAFKRYLQLFPLGQGGLRIRLQDNGSLLPGVTEVFRARGSHPDAQQQCQDQEQGQESFTETFHDNPSKCRYGNLRILHTDYYTQPLSCQQSVTAGRHPLLPPPALPPATRTPWNRGANPLKINVSGQSRPKSLLLTYNRRNSIIYSVYA